MRLAASTYLNSAPLVHSFLAGKQRNRVIFMGDAAPAHCAQMLSSGQCEIALIPVIEYQRVPHLRLIPEVAVASKKQVGSVILAARCPLREVRRVALDGSSRTSQALVKILFARKYQTLPQFYEKMPGTDGIRMFEEADAALIIGDPTFHFKAQAAGRGLEIYDLAEEWQALTGLPFVFAVWAVREDALQDYRRVKLDFVMAKREGLDHIPEIAAHYAATLNLPVTELISYLRKNVNYDLDPENLDGLQTYFQLAKECSLIEQNKEILFVR